MGSKSHVKVHGPEIIDPILRLEPEVTNEKMPNIRSTMSIEDVNQTVKDVYFPAGSRILLPTPESGCFDQFGDGIVVYQDSIENGLRLPLHPFIAAFMRSMRLSIADVSPSTWRYFVGFLTFCRWVKITPQADLFWAFFYSKYENKTFRLVSSKRLVLLDKSVAKDWHSKWFVVVFPPGVRLGFLRSSSQENPPRATVHKHKVSDALREMVRIAQEMVQKYPEVTEWEYLNTPTNLMDTGVDNDEGFPDCYTELPEYGFDKVVTSPPWDAQAAPSYVIVLGFKRQKLVTSKKQHSQAKGGWLSCSDSEEEDGNLEEGISQSKTNTFFDTEAKGEVLISTTQLQSQPKFSGVEETKMMTVAGNQEEVVVVASAKESMEDSKPNAGTEERTIEVTRSSSPERVISLLPASTTGLTVPYNLQGGTCELPPDELAVLQAYRESSSKLKALVRRQLAAQQEVENLRIELAQRQNMIDDLQRIKVEHEDALQKAQAYNSYQKKRLEAKETKLAEMRSQFHKEKELRVNDKVLRDQLEENLRTAKEWAETSKARVQTLMEAEEVEHEEAMRKVKMDLELIQTTIGKAKVKAKERKEKIIGLKDGEMKMLDGISKLQKENEQLVRKSTVLAGEVRTLQAREAVIETFLDEEKRKLWTTQDSLVNASIDHTINEMKTKNMYLELADVCARRSISSFEEYQKGLGVQLAPGFVFQMEDLVASPPPSSSG